MINNLIPTFNETFNVEVKKGILYYPCCGGDTYEPVMLFRDTIQEFHFCDVNMVKLPALECTNRNTQRRSNNHIISTEFIKDYTGQSRNIRTPLEDFFKEISSYNFGSILINSSENREKWITVDDKIISIICHIADALITLSRLNNISVFYYRGDSIGEGGSGQWWLGPEIFNLLLKKLVPGAIIITDGSNYNPAYASVPWHPLFNIEIKSEESFEYNGRHFNYLGVCDYRQNKTKAWQVL